MKISLTLANELKEFYMAQEVRASEYEHAQNNEMHYLVRWSILEGFVKRLTTEYRRNTLRRKLDSWIAYLDQENHERPNKPKFEIDSHTLPQKKEFLAVLQYYALDANDIWTVMDSRGKYRKHRNELAHTGKKFKDMKAFQNLIKELENTANKIKRGLQI